MCRTLYQARPSRGRTPARQRSTSPCSPSLSAAEALCLSNINRAFNIIDTLLTPVAVLQSGAQGLKTSNVSGELENPEDPEDAKDLGRLGEVVEGVVRVEAIEDQGEEEGEDAKEVDHVQEVEDEIPLEKVSAVKKWFLPFLGKQ